MSRCIIALIYHTLFTSKHRPHDTQAALTYRKRGNECAHIWPADTALSGFCLCGTVANVDWRSRAVILVVVGFSSCAAAFAFVPLLPIDLLRIPLFTRSARHLLVLRATASHGLATFICKPCYRSEVETGLLLTPRRWQRWYLALLAGYLIERLHAGLLGALGMVITAVVCAGHAAFVPLI
ncbi:hypothetical protein KCP69_17440 [Salmonella enterica subsp. enterica]|nr:hypothetical protein KCP69_17440 [Salmonella enterica subsp. enterica]